MNHKTAFVAGSLSSAVCVGLIGGAFANPAMALIGLVALNGGFLAFTKESQEPALQRELDSIEVKLVRAEERVIRLDNELAESFRLMEQCKITLQKSDNEKSELIQTIEQLNNKARNLHIQLEGTKKELLNSQFEVDELKADIEDFTFDWENRLNNQTEKLYQERITKELNDNWNEHNRISTEAMQLLLEYQQLARDTRERMESKNIEVDESHTFYKKQTLDYYEGWKEERDAYKVELDQLRKRIEILRIELNAEREGQLLKYKESPQRFDNGSRVGNCIGQLIFELAQISLAMQDGCHEDNGVFTVGYAYSRGLDVFKAVNHIQSITPQILKQTKINTILSVRKYELSELILISFRIDAPVKNYEVEVYRFMKPWTEFSKGILDVHDTKKGGKPTIRVMGATGEGKGVLVKNLVHYYTEQQPEWQILVTDPMHGLSEDYWKMVKAAESATDSATVFGEFVGEHEARADKCSENPNVKLLGVFDEFDKKHSRQDKDAAKEIWTAIRHTNQRMIICGQCAEVGSNGWTWGEMTNCVLITVGKSIPTTLKHYKDIGFSLKRKNELQKQYEEIQEYLRKANEELPRHQQTTVGLVIVDSEDIRWYELPPAEIHWNHSDSIHDSWESAMEVKAVGKSSNLVEQTKQKVVKEKVLHCPECGSTNRKDKVRSTGKIDYKCGDCLSRRKPVE